MIGAPKLSILVFLPKKARNSVPNSTVIKKSFKCLISLHLPLKKSLLIFVLVELLTEKGHN